jgi:oligosaccharide reducing-end xylanase
MSGSCYSGIYRNVFAELGHSESEIDKRIEDTFRTLFYGSDDERIYFPMKEDMGYMLDTGNLDARSEGMSYGMMMCVQMNHKEEFDRLWRFVKKYMHLDSGKNAGYFCWSNGIDGTKNSDGPAPDGEEFFAMALIFAANRWGSGEGILNYLEEAKALLRVMLHQGENGNGGRPMWDSENKLIRFITEVDFSDPSYHLPHFYELYSLYSDETDKDFWRQAAEASRKYLSLACHPETGLSAEYAEFDGTPHYGHVEIFGRHDWYYSDAYRTVANAALDWSWFGSDENERKIAANVQKFFCETVKDNPFGIYAIDGSVLEGEALHPVAMIAVNAQASLASDGIYAAECAEKLWNTPLRTGNRRYYDNCLYMFAMLALSGRYRIW